MSSRDTPPSPIFLGSEDFRICFLVLRQGSISSPDTPFPPFYRKKFVDGTVNLIWKTRQLERLKMQFWYVNKKKIKQRGVFNDATQQTQLYQLTRHYLREPEEVKIFYRIRNITWYGCYDYSILNSKVLLIANKLKCKKTCICGVCMAGTRRQILDFLLYSSMLLLSLLILVWISDPFFFSKDGGLLVAG